MGKQVKDWAPPTDAVEESESQWTPPADAIEEPVKKKESTLAAGSDSQEPAKQPSRLFEQPTPSEQPKLDSGPFNFDRPKTEETSPKKPATIMEAWVDFFRQVPTLATTTEEQKQSSVSKAIDRGTLAAEQAGIVGPFEEKPDAQKINRITEIQKEIKALVPSREYVEFNNSKNVGDALTSLSKSPVKIISELTAESMSALAQYGAARIGAGAVMGAATGSVVPGIGTASGAGGGVAVGLAASSLGLEYSSKFLESIQEQGVNIEDATELQKAFENDDVIDKARTAGLKKGIPIAIFDLISGGVAGKIASRPAKSLVGKIAKGAGEFGAQAALGGGGELAGELVAGEQINPAAIIGEMIGELGTTPIEASNALLTYNKSTKPVDQVIREQTQVVDKNDVTSLEASAEAIQDSIEKGQNLNTNEQSIANSTGEQNTNVNADEQLRDPITSPDEANNNQSISTGPVDSGSNNKVLSEDKLPDNTRRSELETLREQILNSPDDLKWDGKKVTILTEKGADMLRQYDALKRNAGQESETNLATSGQSSITPSAEGEISDNQTSQSDEKRRQEGRQEENLLNPTEQVEETRPASLTRNQDENNTDRGSGLRSGDQGIPQERSSENIQPLRNQSGSDSEPAAGSTVQPESNTDGLQNTQTRLGQRIEASQEPAQVKEKVKGRDNYKPRSIPKTNEEAKSMLSELSDDQAESVIRDSSNTMEGGVRATMAANLYERYKSQNNFDRAADIAVWAAQNLTKAGQETAIAGKIWKSIMSNEDLTVLALEKQVRQQASKALAPVAEQVSMTKQQLDAEIRKAVESQVQAQVEQRIGRVRRISDEKLKKISDAFDSLKVKNIGGAANDITRVLGASVWNGSLEVIKRSVLTGADVVNAIQAGIDYVRDNFKGEWSEDDYRNMLSPAVENMVRDEVDRSKINDEKINTPRLSGRKKKKFIDEVVEEYNKTGQIPDDKFDELYAKQLGYKPFSQEERQKIRELSRIIAEVENFKDNVKNNFTPENLSKYKELMSRAQKANKNLQEFAQRNEGDVWQTLSTILQGNILTPLSIFRNIYANAVYQPMRFFSVAFASPIDYALTELAKTNLLGEKFSSIVGKERSIDVTALQKGYFTGGWNGTMEGLYQMKTGTLPEENQLRDINRQFSPENARRRIAEWAESDPALKNKINDVIEGYFGIPAEGMFRLLNLGDKPFRRAAELARGFEIGTLKGLKGNDLLKFVLVPDQETQLEMEQAGQEATFQNESTLANVVQTAVNFVVDGANKLLGGPGKLLVKSQIPFIRTPANILAETFNYALWPVTIMRGVSSVSQGNKRTGSILIGKGLVGAMVMGVSMKLLELGLMSWDDQEREGKQRERRSLQYDTVPPNALNVSAISRGLSGQGWEQQDDDVWVDYKNMGLQGILMQTYANSWYRTTKEGNEPFKDILQEIGLSTVKIASSSLEQSFLQGTNALLDALKDPEGYAGTKWLINTTEAFSSIVMPRTITGTLQASDEYIRDTQDDKFVNQLANTYKSKLLLGDELPARVNLWGEKITGNPEGRTRFTYYLFDPTRFREVSTDSYKYKLYNEWRKSKFDDAWLPSMPKKTMSIRGVEKKLTTREYEQLAIAIGQARARRVSAYMSRKRIDIDGVKKAYDQGYDEGKRKFLMDMGWSVLSKKALEDLAKN